MSRRDLAMYECAECEFGIRGTVEDPVVWTSLGRFHRGCALKAHERAKETAAERRERQRHERSVRGHQRDMAPMSLVSFK